MLWLRHELGEVQGADADADALPQGDLKVE